MHSTKEKMTLTTPPQSTAISTLGEQYENKGGPALVALIATLDPTGGAIAASIGGLLSYGNSQRTKVKQEYFAEQIKVQLEQHKAAISNLNENLHEAVILALRGVESAASKEKIDRFARIVSGHIIQNSPWNETATALRIISDLEDIHIEILFKASLNIEVESGKAKFYVLDSKYSSAGGMIDGPLNPPSIDIVEALGGAGNAEVRMFCMELMSKGLLHDNDQGAFIKGPVFTLTEAAFWLLEKIKEH